MFKSILIAAFLLLAGPAFAQNPTCPTRAPGDSTNACASTAFVHSATGSGQFIDIRQFPFNAACDGTTDDIAAINSALVAAGGPNGGTVMIPSGHICAFGSTITLQHHVTLQINNNATLKFLGTSGDEIAGTSDGSLDDRMNVLGPGGIDATHASGGGHIIALYGGGNDIISGLFIQANNPSIFVFYGTGNDAIGGGSGNLVLSKVSDITVHGTVGDVIHLVGGLVSSPTNNSFYNINASPGEVVTQHCVSITRFADTQYFYNLNCSMTPTGDGILIGSALGTSHTVLSGTYNSTTGAASVIVSGGVPSTELYPQDTIGLILTGTNVSGLTGGTVTSLGTSGGNTVINFAAATSLGSMTITGGTEATTDTDAWGIHFFGYILFGGNYGVALLETHDDSFYGGDDFQAQINPGISSFSGPLVGVLSQQANYVACHTMGPSYNIGSLCAEHKPYLVATLPTIGGGANVDANAEAYVTDATSCTGGGSLTGGGSTFCHVRYNGASWLGSP